MQMPEAQSSESTPAPRRRGHGLSIAIWVPALVGLALVLVLTAFTSLGVAAPAQAANEPASAIVLL
jgi:hypothetical protein